MSTTDQIKSGLIGMILRHGTEQKSRTGCEGFVEVALALDQLSSSRKTRFFPARATKLSRFPYLEGRRRFRGKKRFSPKATFIPV